jgi:hypothetical protein
MNDTPPPPQREGPTRFLTIAPSRASGADEGTFRAQWASLYHPQRGAVIAAAGGLTLQLTAATTERAWAAAGEALRLHAAGGPGGVITLHRMLGEEGAAQAHHHHHQEPLAP